MSSSRALCVLLMAAAAGCGRPSRPGEVVVYVSHDLLYSEPILREFEQRSGLAVKIVGDTEATKTTGLVNRLLQSRRRPEADVFWNNEAMRTAQLADLGLLQSYVPAAAAGLPAAHCDPAGRWTGFAARARVILYNTQLVAASDAPRSIHDLAAPRFRGRSAIANPLFGTTATHVAALFSHLGDEAAMDYLRRLKANDVRVVPGNAMARNLVMDGELAVCLTDTDDANGALVKGKPVAMVYPDQDGMGTLVIPNTVAVVKGCPNPEGAIALVEHLLSSEVEAVLAQSQAAQMPLRSGIPPLSPAFDLSRVKAMPVDWQKVAARAEESARFVETVFLK